MAKKKGNPAVGCLFIVLLAVGGTMSAFQRNPVLGVAIGLGIVGFGFLLLMLFRKKRCEACNNQIEKKSYIWEIDGKKRRVCVHCNQTFSRRNSSRATKGIR